MSAFEQYITAEKIKARVSELAVQINKDFNGEEVSIVCVLNGSFMFCADLVRELNLPVQMEFMSASSYGDGTESSGELKIKVGIDNDISGKNIILVEDIVDTGLTLTKIIEHIEERNPKAVKVASLLYKPSRNIHPIDIHYLGFEIEDKFVIGYGLDYAGKYRELPYIGIYQES